MACTDADTAAQTSSAAELEALGDQIAELAAHLDAGTYRLLELIRAFDEREGWARAGAHSCAHWLAWRVGLGAVAARERVRVARALADLPLISEALRCGRISYAKARAITRVAHAGNEQALLTYALHGTAAQLEQIVRRYRRVTVAEEQTRHERRGLNVRWDEDGSLVVCGRLTPEQGAALLRSLELAAEQLPAPAPAENDVSAETPEQRRADALALVAQSALGCALAAGTAADRTQVVLHVDAAALRDAEAPGRCGFEPGGDVSAETARRLSCDATLVAVADAPTASTEADAGRKQRTVPPPLRRALVARDGRCRFPGCTHARYVDAHHVQHWADGGATRLDNLVLLCSHHHRLVHEGGFGVRVDAGGELVFTRPDGVVLPAAPLPVSVAPGPGALIAQHRAAGLSIDSHTQPTWDGVPADYPMAVDLLVRYDELARPAGSAAA